MTPVSASSVLAAEPFDGVSASEIVFSLLFVWILHGKDFMLLRELNLLMAHIARIPVSCFSLCCWIWDFVVNGRLSVSYTAN